MAQSATDTPTADPEPIALEATAELDYSSDPDRPLTVEVELVDVVHRRPTVAGAVEVEYDLSRRKAKKVKKILEHKDISLTDTPTA
jgi:hypothetical protein